MSNAIEIINNTRDQERDLSGFDFSAPAELFSSRNKGGRGQVIYKRFDQAVEGIRFAIEDMPGSALLGLCLESEERRFGGQEIRALYDSAAYPLTRRAAAD
jgi:hypothetical protein